VLRPAITQVLYPIRDPPIVEPPEAIERERGASAVSHQAFATEVVVGSDGDAGVHIEPIAFDRTAAPHVTVCCLAGGVFRVRVIAKRSDNSPPHRDGGAGLKRCLRGLVLRALGGGAVHMAFALEPPNRSSAHPAHNRIQFVASG
jgi:hypothetical protein